MKLRNYLLPILYNSRPVDGYWCPVSDEKFVSTGVVDEKKDERPPPTPVNFCEGVESRLATREIQTILSLRRSPVNLKFRIVKSRRRNRLIGNYFYLCFRNVF